MKNTLVERFGVTAMLLSTVGCASKPYTQLQIAQGKGEYLPESGKVDVTCARMRGGGKTAKSKHTDRQEEVRLGADICYSQLPSTTSEDKLSIDASVVSEETTVYGTTTQYQVKLTPIFEYKLFTIGADFEKENPKRKKYPKDPEYVPYTERTGLLIPGYQDLELSLWMGAGYNLDITAKSTDYVTGDNQVNNIPGIEIDGQFFGELSTELVLMGRIPLGMSVRFDHRGEDGMLYLFNGGYRIQW